MTLVLEGGGDRRLVLAENRSCGEGQRGRRGSVFQDSGDMAKNAGTIICTTHFGCCSGNIVKLLQNLAPKLSI